MNHLIPTHPERIYQEWAGIRDWTGYNPALKKNEKPKTEYLCRKCNVYKPYLEMVRNGRYIKNICRKCNTKTSCLWKSRNRPAVNAQERTRRSKWSPEMKKRHSSGVIGSQNRNPITTMLKAARHRAKKKGMEYNLSKHDISIPSTCPILGIPLTGKSLGLSSYSSPSLHRIDNSKGYVKDNVIVISNRANTLIGNATIEELLLIHKFYLGYASPKALEAQTGTPLPIASYNCLSHLVLEKPSGMISHSSGISNP
jgi:hypothetical protein